MNPVRDVAAASIIRDGRILVARRAPGQAMAGLWEFPGGKLDPGETAQECVVRELAEELAITCTAGAILAEHLHVYPGGAINLIAVRVEIVAGDPRLSVHDDLRWATADELLALPLAPADIPIAQALLGEIAAR